MEGKVLFVENSLTISEVIEILRNPPENFIRAAPQKAKAGQVFLFKDACIWLCIPLINQPPFTRASRPLTLMMKCRLNTPTPVALRPVRAFHRRDGISSRCPIPGFSRRDGTGFPVVVPSRVLVGGTGRDVPSLSRPVPRFSNDRTNCFSSLYAAWFERKSVRNLSTGYALEPVHERYTSRLPWAGWILPTAWTPFEHSRRSRVPYSISLFRLHDKNINPFVNGWRLGVMIIQMRLAVKVGCTVFLHLNKLSVPKSSCKFICCKNGWCLKAMLGFTAYVFTHLVPHDVHVL